MSDRKRPSNRVMRRRIMDAAEHYAILCQQHFPKVNLSKLHASRKHLDRLVCAAIPDEEDLALPDPPKRKKKASRR